VLVSKIRMSEEEGNHHRTEQSQAKKRRDSIPFRVHRGQTPPNCTVFTGPRPEGQTIPKLKNHGTTANNRKVHT
jgi:hypothetical protein